MCNFKIYFMQILYAIYIHLITNLPQKYYVEYMTFFVMKDTTVVIMSVVN